jgi:hypothetical protein
MQSTINFVKTGLTNCVLYLVTNLLSDIFFNNLVILTVLVLQSNLNLHKQVF